MKAIEMNNTTGKVYQYWGLARRPRGITLVGTQSPSARTRHTTSLGDADVFYVDLELGAVNRTAAVECISRNIELFIQAAKQHNYTPEEVRSTVAAVQQKTAAGVVKLSGIQPATEQPATEQPATEQVAAEQVATEQPATEQVATEQPATEQVATEQPATEQVARGRGRNKAA